jgi:hypothetical protein
MGGEQNKKMGEGVPTIGVDPKRGFYFMGRLPF